MRPRVPRPGHRAAEQDDADARDVGRVDPATVAGIDWQRGVQRRRQNGVHAGAPASAKTPAARSRGFTLVEVILALALTTLLLGLLSSGVFIVAGDWNRNASLLDASLDEALIILQIDRALHGAFPHSFTNEETLSRQLFFAGESDYLAWVSTVSPQRTPGLTAWELFNVEDEGVYLTLVPAFSDDPSLRLQEAEPILIYPDYSVSFSYLYEDLGETRVWNSEWDGEELLSLPLAVYARFEPENGGQMDEPAELLEVVARIRNNLHRSIQPNMGEQRAL